ncbi:MAG TPA: galactokinase, partial [Candidatus Baltobacteraceae bacterium]|nr:galactokinase [Candidatus Baltobacteraceae bacterium]
DALPMQRRGEWSDYVRGVLIELREAGVHLHGADLRIHGNIPLGAGLSSSASFEVAAALAMLALARVQMPPLDLAKLAQRAEIRHVGTRCGIMDQLAVLCAQPGHALFLDTRSLQWEQIAVPREASIVICNTMIEHELASGAYNERRSQCERAVALLHGRYPQIRALRDVGVEQLAELKSLLPSPIFERARHVVTENGRVMEAVRALQANDLSRLGALMYESHASLRDDYAVSCPQLDMLVEMARSFEGTIGARMTGGGFGGCTVNLVHRDYAAEFRERIAQAYQRETGVVPELYDGTPSAGAALVP